MSCDIKTLISESRDILEEKIQAAKVGSEKELNDFVTAKAKAAFGDEFDAAKAKALVKAAIDDKTDKEGKTDWEGTAGFVTQSFSEEDDLAKLGKEEVKEDEKCKECGEEPCKCEAVKEDEDKEEKSDEEKEEGEDKEKVEEKKKEVKEDDDEDKEDDEDEDKEDDEDEDKEEKSDDEEKEEEGDEEKKEKEE